jgi:hypothetical protein
LPPPAIGFFYTEKTVFHVRVGADYKVAGMGIFSGVLVALLRDDTGKPNWLPAAFFECSASRLPAFWGFRLIGTSDASGWTAKWGYEELIRDDDHINALIERDPSAMEIFSVNSNRDDSFDG